MRCSTPIYNWPLPHPEKDPQALTGQASYWLFPSLSITYFSLQELQCDGNKTECIHGL